MGLYHDLISQRHMFAQAVLRMDQAAWLQSHISGFNFLKGVPGVWYWII
jgi:hypothetical protein